MQNQLTILEEFMTNSDIDELKEAMTPLFPNDEYRKICLRLFLEALNKANSCGNNKWGAYYYNEGVRLLVGNLIVLTIHKNGIWMALDKQSLNEMKDTQILEESHLWRWETGDYSEYKPVPSKNGYYTPSNEDLYIWPLIRDLHFRYIEKVANKYKWLNYKSQSTHSDKLLYYLKDELGLQSIPIPIYSDTEFETAEEIPANEDANLYEGAKKQVTVNAYERNPTARKKCLDNYGYKCSVCGFDFEEVYGKIGAGYIHVHHLKPLNEINEKYKVDPINDLRPVCPNCHSMLHKAKFSIEQLRENLRTNTI